MKAAVCYSGGIRTFPKCYAQNHRILSERFEVDYFISTWETPCYTKVERYEDQLAIEGKTIYSDLLAANDAVTETYLRNLLDFKVVDIQTMDQMAALVNKYAASLTWKIMHPGRLVCQYYKLARCHHLMMNYSKSKNTSYDVVIRLRPDLCIGAIPLVDPDRIYSSHMIHVGNPAPSDRMLNEMIFVSNPSKMLKISNITKNFFKLWNEEDGFGERMSYKNFVAEEIINDVSFFDFDMKLMRENGRDEFF
jgi:hypothetical protein